MSDRHSQHDSDTILNLQKKLGKLKSARAVVASPSTKFELDQEIEEIEKSLMKLLQAGVQSDEIGLNKVDEELIREFFKQCAKYDSQY